MLLNQPSLSRSILTGSTIGSVIEYRKNIIRFSSPSMNQLRITLKNIIVREDIGLLPNGNIVAFVLYLSLFYAPISGLASWLESLQQSLAGAERVTLILDTPSAIENKENAKDLEHVSGEISFRNVSFHYSNKVPVLKNISFTCNNRWEKISTRNKTRSKD